ncbi:SpoIIE family protein phosphatase [Leptospira alexanderi]|uniref:SpoIIE-like protein phosphatase domain protein n=1 Tax=Leptospira alexanderi serovar Manhao 3 str. L 60 TaxID=1049759 RepID=V6IAG8_9LEPT|nr:SpoIIE family protein phosphatase [Leptospira alexanderi]EQA60768.1 SpoIIE-like protein phosphatase domain protein [Leptospira alexanderi serovar Manhao 3 str. L 60]
MNYYLFFPMAAFIANTMFIAFVYARRTGNPIIRSYLFYTIALNAWLFTYTFEWSFPPTPWMTWAFKILSITWLPLGTLYLEFVFTLLNKKPGIFLWLFRIGTLISYLITLSTDWIIQGNIHYYWGNEGEPGPLYFFVIFNFVALPALIGLGILTKSFFVSGRDQKKQTGLAILGSMFAIFLSFYSEIIQVNHQGKMLSMPLTPIGIVIQSFLIFIAITRYGFLRINLEGLAVDLFRDIHDGMILVKRDRSLFFMNESAIKILGISNSIPSHFYPSDFLKGYQESPSYLSKEYEPIFNANCRGVELTRSNIELTGKENGYLFILRDITEKIEYREKIERFYSDFNKDLEIAKIAQTSAISTIFPESSKYKFYSHFQPFELVGGDFLRALKRSDGKLDILFADVSGHGISSAMVAGMLSISFQLLIETNPTPKKALEKIQSLLLNAVLNHHVSAIYLSFDPDTKTLEYSYAGHHPILIFREGEIIPLRGVGRILLITPDTELNNYTFQLKKGDILFLYSDCLFEVRNPEGEILGYENFMLKMNEISVYTPVNILKTCIGQALAFGNGKLTDDLTILILEIF